MHGYMPQRTRAPCTEDETHSPSVGAVAGLPVWQNTLYFGDPALRKGPGEEDISGHGFPLFFLPWTVLGCQLQVADGAQRTHHWGIHPP